MATPFKVEGRRAIIQALRAIGDDAEQIALEAVKHGVKVYEREMIARAPDGPYSEGKLKASIRSGAKVKRGSAVGWAGPRKGGAHGTPIEYGFLHKRSGKRIAPRPFARPTFETKTPQVEREALDFMKRKIEERAKRSAGPDHA